MRALVFALLTAAACSKAPPASTATTDDKRRAAFVGEDTANKYEFTFHPEWGTLAEPA